MNTEAILFFLNVLGKFLLYLLWIFGGLVVILLLLLAIFLFVPFHYKAKLKYDEEAFQFSAKVHFLLHFLNAELSYVKDLFYRLRVTFFTIFSSIKKNEKKKKNDKKNKKEKKKAGIEVVSKKGSKAEERKEEKVNKEVNKEENKEENTELSKEAKEGLILETEKVMKEEVEKERENSPVDEKASDVRTSDEGMDEKDFSDRPDDFTDKISVLIEKAGKKKKEIADTYEDMVNKKNFVLDFFCSEGTLEGIKLLFTESFCLMKALFPKKIKGRIRFGTGDVYTEGQYLTYLCLFYGLYAETLEIEPEWEEKVFEADVEIQGKIRLFTILRICIKVYFSEDFKKLRNNIDFLKSRLGI